jgi:hypothetical protein
MILMALKDEVFTAVAEHLLGLYGKISTGY